MRSDTEQRVDLPIKQCEFCSIRSLLLVKTVVYFYRWLPYDQCYLKVDLRFLDFDDYFGPPIPDNGLGNVIMIG